jgi:hypothetical protein
MYVSGRDVLVRQEQFRDLHLQAERERMIGAWGRRLGAAGRLGAKIAAWLRARRATKHLSRAPSVPVPAHGE